MSVLLFCELKNRMDVVNDNLSHKGLPKVPKNWKIGNFSTKIIHMINKRPAEQIYIPNLITCDCGFGFYSKATVTNV